MNNRSYVWDDYTPGVATGQAFFHLTAETRLTQFDAVLESAGYKIEWKKNGDDAAINHPDGQHMRISSLMPTFRIMPKWVLNGVQTVRIIDPGQEIETPDDIDRLRDAIAEVKRLLAGDGPGQHELHCLLSPNHKDSSEGNSFTAVGPGIAEDCSASHTRLPHYSCLSDA